MGCWDIFCFACGNTCHPMSKYLLEDFLEIYKEYAESVKQNTKIKLASYYLDQCKKFSSDAKNIDKLKTLYKKSQWLKKCTFLTVDDRVIHGCEEVACNIDFQDSKGNTYFQDLNVGSDNSLCYKNNSGIFIHTDCWKFIKSAYKIQLKYSDVAVIPEKRQYNKINSKINYGLIENYWAQDFEFINLAMDSNIYMCESPLVNKKNQTRIKKILSQFKLNTDPKRTGPSISATFYPEKTIKYGINKELWIKKSGKWTPIKDSVKKLSIELNINDETKLENKLNKIACIGEPSIVPIFITGIKLTKKNICKIDLIGSEDLINKIEKEI